MLHSKHTRTHRRTYGSAFKLLEFLLGEVSFFTACDNLKVAHVACLIFN